ncbi:OBG GTPase family GTP-binding protein [Methanopyrus sp.]
MPANLPPEYHELEEKYRKASSPEEKLRITEEMLAVVPKHKGTENLRALLKRRLAKLREEVEKRRQQKSDGGPDYNVKKEGAAQVALVGPPNAGKSTLLRELTNADPDTASYPYTTKEPVPGMMEYKDVQIQLVETPPIYEGFTRGGGSKFVVVIRNADALCLIIDLTEDPVEQLETVLRELESAAIKLNQDPPAVTIEERVTGGIEIRGEDRLDCDPNDVKELLHDAGIHSAVVIIEEDGITLEDVADALDKRIEYKPALLVANKGDAPGSKESYERLVERVDDLEFDLPVVPVSAEKGINLDEFKRRLYDTLGIIRVYTKKPGRKPQKPPIVLTKGATVEDVAREIHSDLAKNLKYARVWGKSVKKDGMMVGRDHVLEDGDVVELHG